MEKNYTPGPWEVKLSAEKDFDVSAKTWSGLATAWIHPKYREQAEANAQLIAAAPELLEALEFIINCQPIDGEDAVLNIEGYNKACSAIAKALGKKEEVK